MHTIIRLAASLFFGIAACAWAQTATKKNLPDDEWLNLVNLATPLVPNDQGGSGKTSGSTAATATGVTNPLTVNPPATVPAKSAGLTAPPDELKSPLQLQIERYEQASQKANAFYTAYPNHAQTPAAKKIEAITALQSVQLGGANYTATALRIGQAYRAEISNPAKDRFDVALAMESLSLPGTLNGGRLVDHGDTYEKLTDKLYDEFGGSPEVCGQYLSLLRTTDPTTSIRVAGKLQNMGVPDGAKREAQLALARNGRIGKPIEELTLATVDGRKIDFATIREVTVVYFWNISSGAGDLALLGRFGATAPAGTRWIYVGFGPDHPKLKEAEAQSPFPGQHCFDPSSLGGAAATALGVQQAPYVSVIGRNGALVGFGRVENLPALVAAANR